MPPLINYEQLLRKYLRHVIDCEAFDYLDQIGSRMSSVDFTPNEILELVKIADEVR